MNVAFILPMPSRKINGGYKVVFEYANYLVSKNDRVTIIYNSDKGNNSKGIPRVLVHLARVYLASAGPKWFDLDRRIKQIVIYDLEKYEFHGFDAVIATAATTSKYVAKASCKRFYFVQDYEIWSNSEDALIESYNYPFDIITVSKWLKTKLKALTTNKITYIPNGINSEIFKINKTINDRHPHSVCILYHKLPRKGADVAIRVLYKLKEKYPDTVAYVFGSPERESTWPEWINYQRNASETQVVQSMNNSRVFLCTSRQEGFGLTGLESIFCGCALVTTDCLGIREYANDDNSIICKIDDEVELYNAVCMLFESRELCEKLITAGESVRKSFDIKSSQKSFFNTLREES